MSNPQTKTIGLGGIAVSDSRLRKLRPELVEELAQSILRQGLIHPIRLRPRGRKIMDGCGYILVAGRHRLEAVRRNHQRGIGPDSIRAEIVEGEDAVAAELVEIDENLMRADLSAAETALHTHRRKEIYEQQHPETKHGGAPGKAGGGKVTKDAKSASFVKATAQSTSRSKRRIERDATRGKRGKEWLGDVAGTVLDKGDELDALVKLPGTERDALIERAKAGEKVSAKTRFKQVRRAERERELGAKIVALPDRRYGVILADPEWRFEPWSRETGMDRAADNHYPTSCTEVIAARDVPSIAAKDCALFLCATAPMLLHAAVVMAAWGFNYVTNVELHKDRFINGYWYRNRHEHLLLGTRGKVPCRAPGEQWESVIEMKVGRHSEKPEQIFEMIESYFPNVPKIELNRRGAPRPGWHAWGNEAATDAADGVPDFLRRAAR